MKKLRDFKDWLKTKSSFTGEVPKDEDDGICVVVNGHGVWRQRDSRCGPRKFGRRRQLRLLETLLLQRQESSRKDVEAAVVSHCDCLGRGLSPIRNRFVSHFDSV